MLAAAADEDEDATRGDMCVDEATDTPTVVGTDELDADTTAPTLVAW